MTMTFTLKTLEKHAKAVTSLLDSIDCDYAFTGVIPETTRIKTHGWYISRPLNDNFIGVEDPLEQLSIPYDRTLRGPNFRLICSRLFRLDEHGKTHILDTDHGDNTLELLEELETVIAGNDYTFARNFIYNKRKQHLVELTWETQASYSENYEVT